MVLQVSDNIIRELTVSGPSTEEEINNAERELGVRFPPEYREGKRPSSHRPKRLSCRRAEVCASLSAFVLDPYPWTRRNNKSRTDFLTFGKAWPHSSDTTCIQWSPRSATI